MDSLPPLKSLLTVYGRKPVLEALEDSALQIFRLHLAESNKPSPIIKSIKKLAQSRQVEIKYHDKKALSRISKNGSQDQGVALDIHMPNFLALEDFVSGQEDSGSLKLMALDSITNPQNLGMIIRSVCASKMNALLIPEKGCAKLDALVIKASAGTLFKCPIIRCSNLAESLSQLKDNGFAVLTLEVDGSRSLLDRSVHESGGKNQQDSSVFVIGNESDGVSDKVKALATDSVYIPMENGVESLNAAVTASLVAFLSHP